MEIIKELGQKIFSSLRIRNYRLYFIGQGLSQIGSWMQIVALGWLVLTLTGSGTQLGTILAFRFFPQLFGGPFGGFFADRFPKRNVLLVTQSASALLALTISVLVFTNTMTVWMLYAFALILGVINLFDNPTRQAFVHEMVGPEYLRNAVTLNSTVSNLALTVGPMIAGSVIAGIGIAACYLANAVSFVAVIGMLMAIRKSELHKDMVARKDRGHVLEGLRYASQTPLVGNILIVMALLGTFAYEFQVSLPLLAQNIFESGAAGYAALLSAMGVGSVFGGLVAASRSKVAPHEFVLSALLFGASMCVTAFMPSLQLAILGMIFVGFFSINLTSVGNTMVQLASAPEVRGRVMSLWSMAIFGSTFIGGPAIGFIAEHFGGRWGLAIGGFSALVGGLYAWVRMLERDQWLFVPAFIRTNTEEDEDTATKT